jgi:5-methylcytosine-specific restriction endonuclease McrA
VKLNDKEQQIEAAWASHQRANVPAWRLQDELRTRLAEAQNWRCCYCGIRMEENRLGGPDRATLEHVIRKADGGCYEERNLVVACFRCNQAKGHEDNELEKIWTYWYCQ